MPAVIDWSSLLWPSSSTSKTQSYKASQQASNPAFAASAPQEPEASNLVQQPLAFLTGGASINPWVLAATLGALLLAFYWTFFVSRKASGRPALLGSGPQKLLTGPTEDVRQPIDFDASELQNELTRRLDEIEAHNKKALAEQVEAIEKRFQQDLDDKVKAIEGHVQKSLGQRLEDIDDDVRRRLKQSVEVFEDGLRTKLNKESFDGIYREVSLRLESLEEGVRIMDSKQLDVEAATIVQRALGQRLNTVEETLGAVEGKTRTSGQRADAFDDSLRVIDSRTKAMSQRLEAVEDNMGSIDAQTTLLSHDVTRGEKAIESVSRQVKTLPDNDRLKEFSDIMETKFSEIEAKVEELEGERMKLLEDAQRNPTLTWSRMDAQEIEPSGPVYTNPEVYSNPDLYTHPEAVEHTPDHHSDKFFAFTPANGHFMPPTPSPSDRSQSSRGSRSSGSSDSFYMKRSTPTPSSSMSKRKRLEAAGFTDTTFASRQRLFHSRTTSTF
ncbi:hypothetical protein PG993_014165 [Apiospora rasikravindrae]|uniref:Uncharacterized protein n=1 Tax=Apiospora rasikravindrae TaxID=990691 RepID=A0ABR1RTF3_9PEZI